MVFDPSGAYTEVVESLAPHFKRLLYATHWQNTFPTSKDMMPGVGLEGIERVEDYHDFIDTADLWLFPDVGTASLQEWLRKQSIPVFGSGYGSRLEQDRWLLHTVLKESGMDVTDAEVIHGIEALRKELQRRDECYVKVSYIRGDCETYHHLSWFATQPWLDDLSARLGPYGTIAEFIVEDPISGDAVEIGLDGFCVDGELLYPSLYGYEVKDSAYLGSTAEVPERLAQVSSQLAPVLKEIKYRGPIANEVRFTSDHGYLIDLTARFPSPPSGVQTMLIENLADIISEGADGTAVEPKFKARYAAQIILKSEWVTTHYLGLKIGEPDLVKIHGHCRIDGKDYAVSPSEIAEFGGACGIGDTLEEAITQAVEAAESVEGFQVTFDAGALNKALETIEDGEKLGLPFGSVIKGERKLA